MPRQLRIEDAGAVGHALSRMDPRRKGEAARSAEGDRKVKTYGLTPFDGQAVVEVAENVIFIGLTRAPSLCQDSSLTPLRNRRPGAPSQSRPVLPLSQAGAGL